MYAKSNKIKTILFSLVMIFTLTSCENFLKATAVKEEIESMIAYANAQSYEIRVECDEGTGSIIGNTIFKQKETDTFTVEFKIASGYYFTGWKLYSKASDGTLTELSNDYLEILSFNTETTDGIYKATIKFHKAITNIVIKPQCILLPAVASFSPAAGTQHYAFAPIQITFNQPVESVDTPAQDSLFKYGTKNISLSVGSLSVTDCFKAPVFNASKTTLTLQPIYEKLIAFMGTSPYADVTVKFGEDITVSIGEVSLPIVQDSASAIVVSYRNGKENDAPTLSDFLAAREEITNPEELPDLIRFSLKSYSGYDSFQYDDIVRNFVYNGIFYLWGKAYDEGSGVKSVTVTRKKTHLAEDVNDPVQDTETSQTYTAQNATFVDDGRGNTFFCIKYELDETGIYLFNVTVKDECENTVDATPFSVIYKDNFFDELSNGFSLGNDYSDNKFLYAFYYGPGREERDNAATKICNTKVYLINCDFYGTYIGNNNEPKFEKFNEGYIPRSIDQYHHYPAYHLKVNSIAGLSFTLNVVVNIENKIIILGAKDYTFPRKPAFEKIENGHIYFTAPETEGENTSSSIWSTSSDPDYLYYFYAKNIYNFIEHDASHGTHSPRSVDLYGEKAGPFTLADLQAMSDGSRNTQALQINDDTVSIKESQKQEYIDVTVALDQNWQENYDSITLRCNYSILKSENDLGNSNAQMNKYVNYTSIQEGESITLSLPTKIFFWYPKSFYTNATDITLTLEGTKNGVSYYSSPKIISISDQDKQLYDNIPCYDCKILGSNDNGMIVTFTDKESGVKKGTVSFNGKNLPMSASTRPDATGYYDVLIPFDSFSFGKNRFTVYMEDNKENKSSKDFMLYYKTKLVAEDGVDQSVSGEWKPKLKDTYIYWDPNVVFNTARFLELKQGSVDIYEFDSYSQTWGDNPTKTLTSIEGGFPNSSTYTIDCSGGNKFVKCQIISDQYWENGNTDIWCNYEIYYTGSNLYNTDYYNQYNILYRNASAKDSVIIGSAAPVFVHTLVTNHSYDEVKDYSIAQWESHATEVGTKVMDFDLYDRTKRYDIPENTIEPGQCYVIIAHYANDTALKSEVMVW